MTVLSDVTIKKLIDEGKLKIDPYDPFLVDTTSVDIRIGNRYYEMKQEDIVFDPAIDFDITEFLIEKPLKDQLMLRPGEVKIVETLEKFEIPDDLVGTIIQRHTGSLTGIAVSGIIHPGSSGHQMLTIRNTGPWNIILRPGSILCQIIFSRTEAPASRVYMEKKMKILLRKLDQVKAQEQQVKEKEDEIKEQLQEIYRLMSHIEEKGEEIDKENQMLDDMSRELDMKKQVVEREKEKLSDLEQFLFTRKEEIEQDKEALRADFEKKLSKLETKERESLEQIQKEEAELKAYEAELVNKESAFDQEKDEFEMEKVLYEKKNEELKQYELELASEKHKLDELKRLYELERERGDINDDYIDIKLRPFNDVFTNLTYSPVTVYGYGVSTPEWLCYTLIRAGLKKDERDTCVVVVDDEGTPADAHEYLLRIIPELEVYEKNKDIYYVQLYDEHDKEEKFGDEVPYHVENVSFENIEKFLREFIEPGKKMRIVLPVDRLYKKKKHDREQFLSFLEDLCEECQKESVMLFLVADPKLKYDPGVDKYTYITLEMDKDHKILNVLGMVVPSTRGTRPIVKYRIEDGMFTIQKFHKTL
jgi:dCTP deaminase